MTNRAIPVVCAVLLLAGCWEVHGDPITDEDEDDDGTLVSGRLDLLFVVDNSHSMSEEQGLLTDVFPQIVYALPHESPEFARAGDLHVGVISSDMGVGGVPVEACQEPENGDDGILRHETPGGIEGCEEQYPAFLGFVQGDDPEPLVRSFDCIATLGTGGCPFEQPLKAMRQALLAHAGGANEGFVRPDSVLAIVMMSDEDDCSARDDSPHAIDIFDLEAPLGPLSMRCATLEDRFLEPVTSYVDALLATRASHPERLVLASIVGVPLGGNCDQDLQCILDSANMQVGLDPYWGDRPAPSCSDEVLGVAQPPRRLVRFAQGLERAGAAVTTHSICQPDWSETASAVARTIGQRLGRVTP
jgi:hypothetical protein